MPGVGNHLSVDAGRVGDLGVALEMAPSGAVVAAEATSRLGTRCGKGEPRRWCGGSVGLQFDQGGRWLGTALISRYPPRWENSPLEASAMTKILDEVQRALLNVRCARLGIAEKRMGQ
jgi:hypothetical protein